MTKKWFHDNENYNCPASLSDHNECTCTLREMTFDAICDRYDREHVSYENHWKECESRNAPEDKQHPSSNHNDIEALIKMVNRIRDERDDACEILNDVGDMCPVYTANHLPDFIEQLLDHVKKLEADRDERR